MPARRRAAAFIGRIALRTKDGRALGIRALPDGRHDHATCQEVAAKFAAEVGLDPADLDAYSYVVQICEGSKAAVVKALRAHLLAKTDASTEDAVQLLERLDDMGLVVRGTTTFAVHAPAVPNVDAWLVDRLVDAVAQPGRAAHASAPPSFDRIRAVLALVYRGSLSDEQAEEILRRRCEGRALAEFIVQARQRGWIARLDLGISEDGRLI